MPILSTVLLTLALSSSPDAATAHEAPKRIANFNRVSTMCEILPADVEELVKKFGIDIESQPVTVQALFENQQKIIHEIPEEVKAELLQLRALCVTMATSNSEKVRAEAENIYISLMRRWTEKPETKKVVDSQLATLRIVNKSLGKIVEITKAMTEVEANLERLDADIRTEVTPLLTLVHRLVENNAAVLVALLEGQKKLNDDMLLAFTKAEEQRDKQHSELKKEIAKLHKWLRTVLLPAPSQPEIVEPLPPSKVDLGVLAG